MCRRAKIALSLIFLRITENTYNVLLSYAVVWRTSTDFSDRVNEFLGHILITEFYILYEISEM